MTLKEFVDSFPRSQRMAIRGWIATKLDISTVYVRSMCCGTRPIPAKYAILLEKITNGAIPRHVTAPEIYPLEDNHSISYLP